MTDSKKEIIIQDSKVEERKFWNANLKNLEILKMIKEEKTIEEIAKELNLKEETVLATVQNKFFNKRLENYLNIKLYDMQVRKVAYLPEAYEKLQKEFKERISNVSDDVIFKEFWKQILSKLENKTISPTIVNFILTGIRKKGQEEESRVYEDSEYVSDEEADVLRKEFDLPSLPSPNPPQNLEENKSQNLEESNNKKYDGEKSAIENTEMDKGDEVEDKQESTD